MAFNINLNTPLPLQSGEMVSSLYGQMDFALPVGEDRAIVRLRLWISEADFNSNPRKKEVWLTEIPRQFQKIVRALTPAQYNNVDTGQIHTVLANILEDGDSHPQYPAGFPVWAGLQDLDPLNTVTYVPAS